jgi:carbon monoxide dehydrogenase subunit G
MRLEQSFEVRADPDRTYAFLIDVHRVAACVPGISSVEERDANRFDGILKVKVGPIGVTYRGTATITSADAAARRATVTAEGTEGVGAGRVHADATMVVVPTDAGSRVTMTTDLQIAGRLAQFGRGIIDGVARRIVEQMAGCIRQSLEGESEAGGGRDAT